MVSQDEFFKELSSAFSYEGCAALFLHYKDGKSAVPRNIRELKGVWTEYTSIRDFNTARIARGKSPIALWRNCPHEHIALPTGGAMVKNEY